MGRKPAYILTGLSEDQVKIGRLVTNVWTPFNAYHDPPTTSYIENVTKLTQHKSTLYSHRNSHTSLFLRLSKLFGIDHDHRSNAFWNIEAESTTTQMLSNYSDVFEALWKRVAAGVCDPDKPKSDLDETREWIQNRLEGNEDVYMVVGIKTVTDAKVSVGQSSGLATTADAGIPVTELTRGVSSLTGISALDVMIALRVGQAGGVGETYEVQGTCVMAVQYCRIKLKRRKIGNGHGEETLAPREIAWEWFLGGRPRVMIPSTTGPKDEFVVTVSLGDIVNKAEIFGDDEESVSDEGENNDEDRIQNVLLEDTELLF